jgi:hypothetical protein
MEKVFLKQLGNQKDINNKPFFQPKLTINQPNDAYEVEADAMADKVMRMEMPSNGLQLKPLPISSVQRKCAHCEEEQKMQRKEMNGSETTADAGLESYVGGLQSGGQTLSAEARSFYEPRFGYDFSNVKVHTDSIASKSAQSINALAYTSGSNIVFNSGQYSPNTDSGKRLLGHELTHVVQQGNRIAAKKIQKQVEPDIASLPAKNYLDRFSNSYYDLDYRSAGDSLSTWVVLEYPDGTIIDFNINDLREESNPAFNLADSMSYGHVGPGNRIFPRELNSRTLPNLWRVRRETINRMEEYNYQIILVALPAVIFIISMAGPTTVVRPTPRASVKTRILQRIMSGYRTPPVSGSVFSAVTVAEELVGSVANITGNGQKMLAAARQLSAMSNLSAAQKVEVILVFFNKIGFAIQGAATQAASYIQIISEDGKYIFQFLKDSGVIRYGKINLQTGQWMWVTL